jgi:signal transduction histidine kinase
MQKTNQQIIATIIVIVILLIIIAVVVLLLTLYYTNTKKRLLKESKLKEANYKQELLKTQVEIQEETLTHISREIHDNISQVLSFVKLNLALTDGLSAADQQKKILESRELVAQAINDLRHLSKSLSFEHIMQLGLIKTLEIEVERINNSGLINIELNINGEVYPLGEQRELVLFRIFQEALNNTLKHADAKQLKISLQYSDDLFNLTVEDDGAGFLTGDLTDKSGSGLKNMRSRATLIGAATIIKSAPGEGCFILVSLNPLQKQLYADGNFPNSTG